MKGKLALCAVLAPVASLGMVPDFQIAFFPGVGRMQNGTGASAVTTGTACAISPYYILTAAHVGGAKFMQNGVEYDVLQTIEHPTADISVKRVAGPMQTALPIKANYFPGAVPTSQTSLAGDAYTMNGYGRTGPYSPTGFPFAGDNQGLLRQGRNRLDLFVPQLSVVIGSGTRVTDYLLYDLDDPMGVSTVNTLGGPAVGTDEGGMSLFDSGCPWTIFENNRHRIVAVGGIVGTFQGSGVLRPLDWGGFGGGANVQTYASWISTNTPDMGRAILAAPTPIIGVVIGGSSANLYDSDNVALTLESNLAAMDLVDSMSMQIDGTTTASPANSMTLTFEGKSNANVSFVKVELKNVATGQFVQVGSFITFANDSTNSLTIPSPNTYIAPSGLVQMRMKSTPISDDVLFYRTSWDVVRIHAS